ncbi:MAG TPA: sigma-70 family RNA polymerase sigma factor [Kofleriaceae bacterium]|jgi:RNA polymerase sigma-70 factor (ECF subfamily)
MRGVAPLAAGDHASLATVLRELRPSLHRYCARMTGSIIDGEDAVQDALVKAVAAFDREGAIENPEGWLFRIAHNTALDLLRRRAREQGSDEELATMEDPRTDADHALATRAALRTFMQLPVAQRQVVILMDVLGYSLDEIAALTERSIPSIKAALHRGRETLRELVASERPPIFDAPTDARLLAYIDRFNARDFDAVRDMLAEDVRLDLVGKRQMNGKPEVRTYFSNYSSMSDWHLVPGVVDGRDVALVYDPAQPDRVAYFVLLTWDHTDKLIAVRDFRYARYAM